MHFEFLVEEPSIETTLNNILSKILKPTDSYLIRVFQGKYDLLSKLPSRLRGYKNYLTEHYRIIVILDRDNDDCIVLKAKLDRIAVEAQLSPKSVVGPSDRFDVLNRIVIQELESWFLGDIYALKFAFPEITNNFVTKNRNLNSDMIVKPSKKLENILQQNNYYSNGMPKIEVAEKISRYMIPNRNRSKSFQVFCSGIQSCYR